MKEAKWPPAHAMAAVLAYTSRPEQFRGRDVIHFVDNSGAEAGLVKGYSRDVDSARLAGIFHCVAAALEANVWCHDARPNTLPP